MSAIKENFTIKDPGYDQRAINLRKHHVALKAHGNPSEMYTRLLAISKSMGITIPPTIDKVKGDAGDVYTGELVEVLEFILGHFGYMPMDEISYAFELSAALKLSNQVPHFNAFNIRYVGQVLGYYQHYFKVQYDKYILARRQEEVENMPPPPKLPTEVINESAYDALKEFIRKNGCFPMIHSWGPAYAHAESKEYIKLTNPEKNTMFNDQMEKVESENKLAALGKKSDRSITVLDAEGIYYSAITRCQKIFLKKHFETIFNKELPDWKLGETHKLNL